MPTEPQSIELSELKPADASPKINTQEIYKLLSESDIADIVQKSLRKRDSKIEVSQHLNTQQNKLAAIVKKPLYEDSKQAITKNFSTHNNRPKTTEEIVQDILTKTFGRS